MSTLRHHAQRTVLIVVAGLLGSLLFAPMAALADEGLVPGQEASVQAAGGETSLRSAPSYDAPVVSTVSDGASISIVEGQVSGLDGSLWYPATASGLTGFISVDSVTGELDSTDLEPVDDPVTESETETADTVTSSRPWQEPIDNGVVVNNDSDALPAEGLACRVNAQADADLIVRLSLGNAVEVTGEEVWAEGLAFLPVNCAGVGGFVRGDYIQLASEVTVVEEPEEITPEEAVTEDVATEMTATEEVSTEEPAEELTTEELVEEAEGAAPEEVLIEETVDEVVTVEVATGKQAQEAAAEGSASEVAATEVVGTEEPAEDAATEEIATEEPTEEVATEGPTEADATEEVVTLEAATNALTSEGAATEEIAEEVAPETVTTEAIAAERVVTSEAPATEEAATEQAAAATEENPVESEVSGATTVDASTTPVPNQEVAFEQQAQSRVDPGQVIGTAEVVGTNGDGLRCRTSASSDASTITTLAEGTIVQVLSVERNGYLGVICGGEAGFAKVEFLYSGGAGDEIAASAGSVTVVGSGGGLNCRSGAGTSFGVLTVLRDGTKLPIRGASSNGWAPVVCGGQNGYVSIDYVEATRSTSDSSAGDGRGGMVTVTGTNGSGLRCRTTASLSGSVITVIPDGGTIAVRGGASNGWQPVTCGGRAGFVSTEFITSPSGGSTSGGSTPAPSPVTGSATVSGTNGDGVRCRNAGSTSANVITVLAEGTRVSTRGGAQGGWVPVVCGGTNGYVSAQYLTIGSSGSAPSPSAPGTSGMVSGDHARVTSTLNLRYSASMGAGIAITAPEGTIVLITGGVTNGFYPVNWDGLKGFMSKDYLVKTTAALSKRGGSGATSPPPTSGDSGSNSTGNAMVSFALRYEGYPYVWATHGPSSFDCSGFTYWVTKNVTGKDIGTGLWTQVSAGTPVSRANLQPGDLVFFQNTYKAGLSHSGVYIGNNRFIHAENETTGVRISDLNSTYYSSRWYGAVRMT